MTIYKEWVIRLYVCCFVREVLIEQIRQNGKHTVYSLQIYYERSFL
jgi:hypothetical protein